MGNALNYNDTHEPRRLIDCDNCGKRFLNYPDNVPTCSDCLQNPTIKRQRSRNSTPIAFLFET